MDHKSAAPALYGVMAEFEDPTSLVEAARRTYDEGYRQFDVVLAVSDSRNVRRDASARQARAAPRAARRIDGLCAPGSDLQVWVSAIAYPLNIGGRPYLSWPMFVPVTFELTILFACIRRGVRHARPERAADAVSPGLQRRAIHGAREPGSVLPGDRGDRHEVRSRPHARVSAELSGRRTSMMSRSSSQFAGRGSRFAVRDWRERLRPERAAGGERREAAPASESAWGWGPTRSDKCRRSPPQAGRDSVSVLDRRGRCRQDMHNQPKYRGLRPSTFFADGSSARPLVEGTVARGTLQDDEAFFTGKVDKVTVKELPFPVDEAVLNRGQERFDIYCSPCHDRTGSGNGMVVQRGFKRQPPSYHIERLASGGRRLLLRRDYQRIRRDAGLQGADRAARSVGDRRLHPGAAVAASTRPAADVPGGDPTKVPQPAVGRRRARARRNIDRMDTHAVITDVPALARLQRWGLVAGFWGLLAGVIGAFLNVDQFLRSWLIGFLFCLGSDDGIARAADAAAHVRRASGDSSLAASAKRRAAIFRSLRCCSSRCCSACPAVRMGPARCGADRSHHPDEGALPECAVLHRPRDPVFRHLGRCARGC